jgi:hypothetical protein
VGYSSAMRLIPMYTHRFQECNQCIPDVELSWQTESSVWEFYNRQIHIAFLQIQVQLHIALDSTGLGDLTCLVSE